MPSYYRIFKKCHCNLIFQKMPLQILLKVVIVVNGSKDANAMAFSKDENTVHFMNIQELQLHVSN